MKLSKIKLVNLLWALILLLLFFSEPLVNYFSTISSIDEVLAIMAALSIPIIIYNRSFDTKLVLRIQIIVLLMVFILIIGAISNYTSGYNVSFFSKIIDALTLIKVPTTFIFFTYMLSNEDKLEILFLLRIPVFVFVLSAFTFDLMNIIHLVNMSYDIRYGFNSFRFYFNNPGSLNERMFISLAVISSLKSKKLKILLMFFSMIVIISTFRFNAMISLIIGGILYIFYSKNKKISLRTMLPLSILAAYLAKNQIKSYFFMGESPRQLLFQNGLRLSVKNFPFGTGFSTFGSDQAAKNYSEIYYELGFDRVWGMQPMNSMFLHDSFWPVILAQYGILATLMYLILLINIIQMILNADSINKVVMVLLVLYMVISSIGASVLLSPEGLTLFIFVALLIKTDSIQRES